MFQTLSLLLLISIGYIANNLYLPSLPFIGDDFGVSNSLVQLTLFAYMISFAFTPLVFGPLSDHFGRKKVIISGLYVLLLGTVGCYWATSINWLIAFRFIQGIGGGAIAISARAIVPDLFKGVKLAKKISQITMFLPLAITLGPVFGGYLQENFGWRRVFFCLVIYVVLMIVKMFFIKESLANQNKRAFSSIFLSYKELITNKRFIVIAFGIVFPGIGMSVYLALSAFLFQEIIGLTPSEYGFLSVYICGVVMFVSFINQKLLAIYSTDKLLWLGVWMMGLSGGMLLCFHFADWLTFWSVLFPVLLYFTCVPLCVANFFSKAFEIIKHSYGAAGALITAAQFFSASLGILIFSMTNQSSILPLAICYILVSFFTGCAVRYSQALELESSRKD